jgi:hypothetical protein
MKKHRKAGRPKGSFKHGNLSIMRYREMKALEKSLFKHKQDIMRDILSRLRFLIFISEKQKQLSSRVRQLIKTQEEQDFETLIEEEEKQNGK